jgi:flagellar biosynthesis protein FliQ
MDTEEIAKISIDRFAEQLSKAEAVLLWQLLLGLSIGVVSSLPSLATPAERTYRSLTVSVVSAFFQAA